MPPSPEQVADPAMVAPRASAVFASKRQCTEGHSRDVDRDVQFDRLLRARANDHIGVALLAVTLDHEPGQRARQEGQIIPMRDPVLIIYRGLHKEVFSSLVIMRLNREFRPSDWPTRN